MDQQIRRIRKTKFTMRRARLSRSSEYQNLRHVVPSLRRQRDVGEVEVVTEAARYIDHLHKTLIERFTVCGIPDSLKDALGTNDVNELGSQHIMNLVAQMANNQRQQQQNQDSKQRQSTQQQQQKIQETITSAGVGSHHINKQQRRLLRLNTRRPHSLATIHNSRLMNCHHHHHLTPTITNNNHRQLVQQQMDARRTSTILSGDQLKEQRETHKSTKK